MKKVCIIFLALLLAAAMAIPAYAAEGDLEVTNPEASPGETVYLTLRLNRSVTGDSVAVSYTFDSSVLEALTDNHVWSQKGALQGFGLDHMGVWASETAKDLKGDICVLAFRVRKNITLTQTAVQCKVSVKNGAEFTGKFETEAKISQACNHTYGPWAAANQADHSKSCSLCGRTQVQSHRWDSGVRTESTTLPNTDIMTYTCNECGYSYQEEIPAEADPTLPEKIDPIPDTIPTLPPTMPPQETTEDNRVELPPVQTEPPREPEKDAPTQPTGGLQGSSNPQGGSSNKDSTGSQGSNQGSTNNQGTANSQPGTSSQGNGGNANNGANGNPSSSYVPDTTLPYTDYNQGEGDEIQTYTMPGVIPVDPNEVDQDHDHDHDHDHAVEMTDSGNPTVTAIAVFAVMAAAVGGAMIYLKKKR